MPTPKAKTTGTKSATIPTEVSRASALRDKRKAAGEPGGNCNWIFEVDYSINSKKPRLFVYSIKDQVLYKYKCAHGSGGKNGGTNDGKCREVSNVDGSKCSSLGDLLTGEHYTSDLVGEAVRLNGLSKSNSKNFARGIVIHGADYVTDNEAGTDSDVCGRSFGCVVVDDQYISRKGGGELIEILKGGSLGVAHNGGKPTLP